MTRQTNVTGAESCWDDGFQDDSACEKYLQEQKAKLIAGSADESEEFEDEDETEEVSEESEEESEDIHDSAEEEESEESEDAESDEESDSAETAKGKKMVKAKTSGKTTKADAIRAIIAARQEAGVDIRPRDIKAALEKKGIEVNSSQISITMRAMGLPPTKVGAGRPAKAHAEPAEPKSRATAKIRAVPPEADGEEEAALEQAATLLKTAGSYDAALSALNLCRKIMGRG